MLTEQDKADIKNIIENSKFRTQVIPNNVHWDVYSFSNNFTRIFPGNTVLFINTATVPLAPPVNTPAVLINDNFRLIPGASLALNCNKDEVDATIYKCTFETGANLIVWVKKDAGIILPGQWKDNVNYANVPKPNKRNQKQIPRKRRGLTDF